MPAIRRALPADESAILALMPRLAEFPVPPWRTAGEIASADRAIVLEGLHNSSADQAIFVVEEAGALLGFLFVVVRTDYFTTTPYAYIEDVAIAAAAEGRGLGRQLMAEGEAWARALGLGRIGLSVWAQNTRARGFYERLGYRPETMHYLRDL